MFRAPLSNPDSWVEKEISFSQATQINCDEYHPMEDAKPGVNCEDGSEDNLRNADAKVTCHCLIVYMHL